MNIDTLYHRLGITPAQLAEFCQNAQITELALFGSILREDFRPDSDIDILVTFTPDCNIDLMGFVGLEYDLEDWLHREVDLVEKETVEQDRNWIRRKEILNNHQVIYESRSLLPA
ncbi:MAG: nucleotidyltransferase domain-containing protein [Cyanobacteria bacterium]|nr:nucleotidyltransferase domain-containing protein [Cyanobacteriota bacterium]